MGIYTLGNPVDLDAFPTNRVTGALIVEDHGLVTVIRPDGTKDGPFTAPYGTPTGETPRYRYAYLPPASGDYLWRCTSDPPGEWAEESGFYVKPSPFLPSI